MKNHLVAALCILVLCATDVYADARQSHAEIHKVATEFIQDKTQGLPGKVNVKVNNVDPRISLPACTQLEAFLPTGAALLGKTSIGIRCNEKNGWSLFVSATITTTMTMLVSNKPLTQGQVLSASDFSVQTGEMSQPGIVTDESQIIGKILKYGVNAGQLLKQDMFRSPYTVMQGQTVQLLSEGQGFKLRTEGVAMSNAAEGQSVQVKVSSGQLINGVAQSDGTVATRQ